MNSLKKYLSLVAAIVGIGSLVIATDIPVQRYTVGPSDTEIYELDDDGDLALTGGLSTGNSISPYSRTIAQINAITPTAAGALLVCSNCTQSAICISSGTGRGAFTVIATTGTFVGSSYSGMTHCQ